MSGKGTLEEQLQYAKDQMAKAERGGKVEYGGSIMWLMIYADWAIEHDIIQEKLNGQ